MSIRRTAVATLFCIASSTCGPGWEAAAAPSRWESAMAAFEEEDSESPPEPGQILFIGSSSIRLWNLEHSFPDTATINRGFGGSELSDTIEFASRIVFPYRPSAIFLYAGDNDIAKGKSASDVFEDFVTFSDLVKKHLPDTRLIFIAIKPSLKRWEQWPEMRRANDLIYGYTRGVANRGFADISSVTLGDDGKPKRELFVDDLLHLSRKGYSAWSEVISPLLKP